MTSAGAQGVPAPTIAHPHPSTPLGHGPKQAKILLHRSISLTHTPTRALVKHASYLRSGGIVYLGIGVGGVDRVEHPEARVLEGPVAQEIEDLAHGLSVPLLYLGGGVVDLQAGFP